MVLALRTERVKKKEEYEIFVCMLKDVVRVKFETSSDLDVAFDKLKSPLEGFNKFLPEAPSDKTNATIMDVMKDEVKLFAKRKNALTNNIQRVYTYVWGQCTPSLQACVRGEPDYEEKLEVSDLVWLLKVLRSLTAGVDKQANEYLNLFNGIAKLIFVKHFKTETNDGYLDRFNTNVQALDLSNG